MNNNLRVAAFLLSLVLLCVPFSLISAGLNTMDDAMVKPVSEQNIDMDMMDMDDMEDEDSDDQEDEDDLFETEDDLDEDEDASFKPV